VEDARGSSTVHVPRPWLRLCDGLAWTMVLFGLMLPTSMASLHGCEMRTGDQPVQVIVFVDSSLLGFFFILIMALILLGLGVLVPLLIWIVTYARSFARRGEVPAFQPASTSPFPSRTLSTTLAALFAVTWGALLLGPSLRFEPDSRAFLTVILGHGFGFVGDRVQVGGAELGGLLLFLQIAILVAGVLLIWPRYVLFFTHLSEVGVAALLFFWPVFPRFRLQVAESGQVNAVVVQDLSSPDPFTANPHIMRSVAEAYVAANPGSFLGHIAPG
jgi:hypothetical protein